MGRAKDLTNQQFGELTALYPLPERKNGNVVWHCKCSCGNECDVIARSLTSGHTRSCGHIQKRDLTNQRFGKLVAKYPLKERNKNNWLIWHCVCDCGNECDVAGRYLVRDEVKSCGCLQNELCHNLVGQRFGKLTVISKTDRRTKSGGIIWHCKCDCGNELDVSGNSLITGNTKSCGCIRSSGEEKISNILNENHISFIKEKSFNDFFNETEQSKYRYDFYLEQYNTLIEYDGRQHFYSDNSGWNTKEKLENTQKHDLIKNQYAKDHNINLIRIPYWEYNTITIDDLLPETSRFII